MQVRPVVLLTLIGLTLSGVAWAGHHDLNPLYQRDRTVTMTGKVASVEWSNPHVVVTLAVENPARQTWRIEMDPPGALGRRGYSRDQIAAGTTITLVAHPAKEGGASAVAKTLTLASGQQLSVSTDTSWNWRQMAR